MDIELEGGLDGRGLRFGIVAAQFHPDITGNLLHGALEQLRELGVSDHDIRVVRVPGAFELPIAVSRLAKKEKFNALIALGCVIRGETPHFDYVCQAAMRGCVDVSLQKNLPVCFGVLTVDDRKQAELRSDPKKLGSTQNMKGKKNITSNKGAEAALTAVQMANLLRIL